VYIQAQLHNHQHTCRISTLHRVHYSKKRSMASATPSWSCELVT
jgi:hypothetical protein